MPGGMANQGDVGGVAIGAVMVSPYTFVLLLNFLGAKRSEEMTIEGLMRRFLWKGHELGQSRCLAMVWCDIVCQPTK